MINMSEQIARVELRTQIVNLKSEVAATAADASEVERTRELAMNLLEAALEYFDGIEQELREESLACLAGDSSQRTAREAHACVAIAGLIRCAHEDRTTIDVPRPGGGEPEPIAGVTPDRWCLRCGAYRIGMGGSWRRPNLLEELAGFVTEGCQSRTPTRRPPSLASSR